MARGQGAVVVLALLWLALNAAAIAQTEALVIEPSLKAPREKLLEWKSAEGQTYWYRLPKAIDAKVPPNLLLMLHGTGLDHRWSFFNYPILKDFRPDDIVVSPDGLTPGQGTTFNFVQGKKDGDQIVGLIAAFKKAFPIGRVVLYGHSQGAFFCYWFAGEHPELVDGIVAHAGNVLDVQHSPLAKQKLAVAILHGRADAVVPVDCAIRTEKIYREQGYQKVKLEIVEGLTAQSGHWPLPGPVARLLEWVDQVSTQSAHQALRTAVSALTKPEPDLAVVVEQLGHAKKLLPKAESADRKLLGPQIDQLETFLAEARGLIAAQLLEDKATLDPKASYGPWVPSFQLGDAAFGKDAEWRRALVKPKDLADRHDKALAKAEKQLEKPSKGALTAATKAYEEAFLAADAERFGTTLLPLLESKGDQDAHARVKALVEERSKDRAAARKAAAELLAPRIAALREAAPDLFGGAAAAPSSNPGS